MGNIYSVGTSGLNVAKTALSTIANNVANVNTPGYTRQIVDVKVQPGTGLGTSFVGSGVQVGGVKAQYNQFLESALTLSIGKSSSSQELDSMYSQLEQSLSGATNGIASNVSTVKANLTTMAANPSSVPARQQFLSSLQGLTSSIQNVNGLLAQQQNQVNQSLQDSSNQINTLLSKIATLNDSITNTEVKESNGTVLEQNKSNDLRDQRQQLVNNLAQYVQINTIDQPEGLTVLAGGTALVVGGKAATLTTAQDPQDPTQVVTSIQTSAGTIKIDPVALGGKIGADSDFAKNGLAPAIASLNQYAGILGSAINDQLQKGINLYGQPGAPLLKLDSATAIPNNRNTGTLGVSLSVNAYQTQAANYQLQYTTASGYALTRLPDTQVLASGATLPLSFDGITINSLGGTPSNGDSFLLKPFGDTAGGLSLLSNDPKSLALASPLTSKAATTNTSDAVIASVKVTSGLPLNTNLTAPVSITFTSPTQYTISGTGIGTLTGQPFQSGQTISYNGWSTSITGTPKAGDVFSIGPATNNAGDASNANDMIALLESKNFGNGQQTISDFSGAIQSSVGTRASLASTNAKADEALMNLAQSNRDSYSGVNLDEEAADLAKWQQIYSANAQVLATAKQLFSSIVGLLS